MRTPKEDAKELVDKYIKIISDINPLNDYGKAAKQCALICVGEKQETIDKMFNGYYTMPEEWQKEYDELEEVKQEINKL